MKKPTKDQIAAEIAALKKLKPVGPFARKTAATIDVQLDVLNNGGVVDDTCDADGAKRVFIMPDAGCC